MIVVYIRSLNDTILQDLSGLLVGHGKVQQRSHLFLSHRPQLTLLCCSKRLSIALTSLPALVGLEKGSIFILTSGVGKLV
jgi:hypothetical protein